MNPEFQIFTNSIIFQLRDEWRGGYRVMHSTTYQHNHTLTPHLQDPWRFKLATYEKTAFPTGRLADIFVQ